MIAVRIGPDISLAVVGAPSYFRKQPEPKRPQDFIDHDASICGFQPMAVCTPGSSKKVLAN